MKSEYRNAYSTAQVKPNQCLPPEMASVMEVLGVSTQPAHRKEGHASALMREVIRDADKTKTVLILSPRPFGHIGLLNLRSWYEKFGFVQIQQNPVLMARQPLPPIRVNGEFASMEIH
jgi:N-acetylglutamate synthase-like GNAT family acetyltransferase